eukprot:c41587_g1_i1 orf=596-820(+)
MLTLLQPADIFAKSREIRKPNMRRRMRRCLTLDLLRKFITRLKELTDQMATIRIFIPSEDLARRFIFFHGSMKT